MSAQPEEVKVLDRVAAMEINQDPTGKRWVIVTERATGLRRVRVEPYHAGTNIPSAFGGHWTSRSKLDTAIQGWLTVMWDKSDSARKVLSKPAAKTQPEKRRDEIIKNARAKDRKEVLHPKSGAEHGK